MISRLVLSRSVFIFREGGDSLQLPSPHAAVSGVMEGLCPVKGPHTYHGEYKQ